VNRRPHFNEARVALLELLDVPLRLHEAGGGLTVVCMDEFQDLLVADALDGLVRSVIQHHGEAAAYVFAGSQPSLMRALFSDHERPFYGQARPLELPRLPVAEATADIEEFTVLIDRFISRATRSRLEPSSCSPAGQLTSHSHTSFTYMHDKRAQNRAPGSRPGRR
jgi:hypothetical protein